MALPQDTLSTVWDIIVSKHEDFLQHSLCPDSTDLSFTGILNLKNKLLYRNTVGYNFWNFQFPLLSYTCHHCCTGPHLRLWLHSKLCRSDTHIKLVSMENEENRSCCCRDRPQRCISFHNVSLPMTKILKSGITFAWLVQAAIPDAAHRQEWQHFPGKKRSRLFLLISDNPFRSLQNRILP